MTLNLALTSRGRFDWHVHSAGKLKIIISSNWEPSPQCGQITVTSAA